MPTPKKKEPAKPRAKTKSLEPEAPKREARKPEGSAAKRTPRPKVLGADPVPEAGRLAKAARSAVSSVVKRITAWSYSRYADYRRCPFYAKLKFVDKMKEPDNMAQSRGTAIHKSAEAYLKGEQRVMPPEFKAFAKELKALRDARAIPERQLAFTERFAAETGWFDPPAWVRVKLDALLFVPAPKRGKAPNRVEVYDWKTGKRYVPDHDEQLELYAIAGFLLYPDAEEVLAADWYVDSGTAESRTFKRAELPKLIKTWEARVRPMLTDTEFAPRPNDKCRFCHFRKANGGPCKF